MEKDLPYRFREQQFRRYEEVIDQIVAVYPGRIEFNPSSFNLSPETFSCRLRDAVRSLSLYHWPTKIDVEKFQAIHQEIMVSVGPTGKVSAGGKQIDILSAPTPGLVVDAIQTPDIFRVLDALVILHHAKVLTVPTKVVGLEKDFIPSFQGWDVAVRYNVETKTLEIL